MPFRLLSGQGMPGKHCSTVLSVHAKVAKPLCHISGKIPCPSLSKSFTGSPKSWCLLAVLSASSKWIKVMLYIVKGHFVMSCSVQVSVAISWCCQLAQWCNLLLHSKFWQKQRGAVWHRHLGARGGDVREPRESHHKGKEAEVRPQNSTTLTIRRVCIRPVYNVRTADWAGEDFDFLSSLWSNLVLKEKQFPNRWPQGQALAMTQSPNCHCQGGQRGRGLQRVKAPAKQKSATV